MDDITQRVESLVIDASNGAVDLEGLREAKGVLSDAGLDSIGIVGLIEGIESEFVIVIDPNADSSFLMCVDTIVAFVRSQSVMEAVR
ncbi:hypothetical protein GOZ90_24505 [Agrobacterium vitis]|uniref:Uncharacterized protein n=1 Tax=Agrobacterium vitis TaxID=373 RepID=A0A6L6VQS7_AGRVI|nr:hypothetical protein [Agrobacterium vitis]MUZ75832.1 hypothetical protein [Agrobacterium vitis]MVA22744.1 hypothetical protein [Agrobacterium vitis]